MIKNIKGNFESAAFEVELAPDRHLDTMKLLMAIGGSSAFLGIIALGAVIVGAAPVAFFMLPVALGLTFAFSRSHYTGLQRQNIKLDERGLHLTYSHPDYDQPDRFENMNPRMTRIERHPTRHTTVVGYMSKRYELGRFLGHQEKENLYKDLRLALRRWDPVSRPA